MNMISAIRQRIHHFVFALASRLTRRRGRDAVRASIAAARVSREIDEWIWGPIEWAATLAARRKLPPIVERSSSTQLTAVDRHWGGHTIRGRFFLSRRDSLEYITELTDGRPYKRKLLRLHGPHAGKTILDYGCGPGNDLAGFAEYSGASRIIGVDISRRALGMARARVSWHARDPGIFTFIRIRDDDTTLPLPDESVDYIQSLGVIHHASHPNSILRELSRVLKRDGEIRVMLYNANSVHIQLVIGYVQRFVQEIQAELTPEEAFQKTADLEAPIARCVRPMEVSTWLAGTGLHGEFLGGYFVPGELDNYYGHIRDALAEPRLSAEQRAFLRALAPNADGVPLYQGLPAGLGGVYRFTKTEGARKTADVSAV